AIDALGIVGCVTHALSAPRPAASCPVSICAHASSAAVGGALMRKIMLINVTHSEESRVGILNDRVLESFEIESLSREHLKGNIYKGTVHRIHPALEAAFVDIGAERDAFLPIDEICFRNLSTPPPPLNNGDNGKRRRRIRDLLKPGEEILVQIAKEQFANKPPTLTTFY